MAMSANLPFHPSDYRVWSIEVAANSVPEIRLRRKKEEKKTDEANELKLRAIKNDRF